MKVLDRRKFLIAGASGMTGRTMLPQSTGGRSYQPAAPSTFQFLVQPGMVARYDSSTRQTSHALPSAFLPTSEDQIANLLSPQSYSVEQLQTWVEQKSATCCTSSLDTAAASADPLDVLMNMPLIGTPAVSDIEAVIGNLADGVGLDVTLDFLSSYTNALAPAYSVSNLSGVPVSKSSQCISAARPAGNRIAAKRQCSAIG